MELRVLWSTPSDRFLTPIMLLRRILCIGCLEILKLGMQWYMVLHVGKLSTQLITLSAHQSEEMRWQRMVGVVICCLEYSPSGNQAPGTKGGSGKGSLSYSSFPRMFLRQLTMTPSLTMGSVFSGHSLAHTVLEGDRQNSFEFMDLSSCDFN